MTVILFVITAILFVLGFAPWISPRDENAALVGVLAWYVFWGMLWVDFMWLCVRALWKYIHAERPRRYKEYDEPRSGVSNSMFGR